MQASASTGAGANIGTACVYADEQLPPWAILGEYGSDSAKGAGRTEYLWLPADDAIPVPMHSHCFASDGWI